MPTVPDRDPQDHAVRIVAAAIEILRSRDGLPLTDEQIDERARNAVTGLGAEFDLVRLDVVADPFVHLELAERRLGALAVSR